MTNGVDGSHLKAFLERIERLDAEKSAISADISEVYSEAKGTGYDVKILRKIVSLRKKQESARREEAEIMGIYLSALGMQMDLPL